MRAVWLSKPGAQHTLRVTQRAGVLWEGSRGRYPAASSAPKVLPSVDGTPADLPILLIQRAVGTPSVLCLVLNPPYCDQTLTHIIKCYLIHWERLPSFSALYLQSTGKNSVYQTLL